MLVGDLVQPAAAFAEVAAVVDAGQHQDGYRIRIGLADWRRGIHQAGPGDQAADARASGGAGIAVGHEAGALLVAHADVAHPAVGEAAIEFERVDARNPEHRIDPVGFQQRDRRVTADLIRPHAIFPIELPTYAKLYTACWHLS